MALWHGMLKGLGVTLMMRYGATAVQSKERIVQIVRECSTLFYHLQPASTLPF